MHRNLISHNGAAAIDLSLHVDDPIVVNHLAKFKKDERPEKALEALQFGVVAMQTLCPALDAQVVRKEFAKCLRIESIYINLGWTYQ